MIPNPARQVSLDSWPAPPGNGFTEKPGDYSYITGQNGLPLGGLPNGSIYFHWDLPPDFPQQAWINYIRVAANGPVPGLAPKTEIYVWVDPAGQLYHTSRPPGAQNGDQHNTITLLHDFLDELPYVQERRMEYPILLDRGAAGDLMQAELTNTFPVDWLNIEIGYLVAVT